MSTLPKMADENIASMFEQLNVVSKGKSDSQRFQSLLGDVHQQQQRDPLKVTLNNLQIQQQQQQPNGSSNRAPSMLIRKASVDRLNRVPSVVRKPSIDRMNTVNGGAGASGSNTLARKPSVDLHNRQPSLIRKGSLDGLSVNLNTKRVISASTSAKAFHAQRVIDIGTYDGSLERDEKRGRRSNDVKGDLLDFDVHK